MYYSPLRYPGGKGKLTPLIKQIIDKLNIVDGTYIEPFAGGAGIAIELLETGIVKEIVINDYDKGVASFWKAIINESERFINMIMDVPLTIDEWEKQREIVFSQNKYSFELGFAAFFLNRTNRSGIIKGGPIGGYEQSGCWNLESRFNRVHLAQRVKSISDLKSQIHVYNKDIYSFLDNYIPKYEDNALVYFDPPYYNKSRQLYLNFFDDEDHKRIQKTIEMKVNCNWIITYDDTPEIINLYDGYECMRFDLSYTAHTRRNANEIIVFKSEDMIPQTRHIVCGGKDINLRKVSA